MGKNEINGEKCELLEIFQQSCDGESLAKESPQGNECN